MNHRRLIVYGSAPGTMADLAQIPNLEKWHLMGVGMDAPILARTYLVATNHPEDIPEIRRRFGAAPLIVGPAPAPGIDIVAPYDPPRERSGGSAMTAVLAALDLGYTRIVLAGIPLTGAAPEGNPYEAFRSGWEDMRHLLGPVRSMSGWTRELCGPPPPAWFTFQEGV